MTPRLVEVVARAIKRNVDAGEWWNEQHCAMDVLKAIRRGHRIVRKKKKICPDAQKT